MLAGLLVLASHVPLGRLVLARGIVFIDLAVAQVAALGVVVGTALAGAVLIATINALAVGYLVFADKVANRSANLFDRVRDAPSELTLVVLVSTTLINAFGVRLLSLINNIGVGAEILAMLVFALVLLIFFRHQPFDVLFQTAGVESTTGGSFSPVFLVAMFMALSSAVLADFYAQRRGDSNPEGRREARCLGA